jgi:hypothetical protein
VVYSLGATSQITKYKSVFEFLKSVEKEYQSLIYQKKLEEVELRLPLEEEKIAVRAGTPSVY